MSESKAIILVGSRWHNPWEGGEILMNLLAEEGISAIRTDQGSVLDPARLAETSLVVFYCEGRWDANEPASRRLTPQQEAELVNYVKRGGGFVGVHGAAVFRHDYELYPELLGGMFIKHPKMCEFTVKVENRSHPITQGVSDYSILDEPYIVDWYPGSELLLSGDWDGEKHPLGWAKEYGKGRVCYLANGHDRRSLETPEFQRLFRNAARWCARL